MLPIRYSFTPANASTTGFAASVTGATFTLTSTAATDSLAHRVTVLNNTVTNHSAKTLTFTGTDVDGFALTETIAAPGASATVTTTGYYKTLTSVTVSATIGADTFSIGWAAQFISPTIGLDRNGGITGLNVIVSGTINYTIQQTFNEIQTLTRTSINWMDNDDSALVSSVVNSNGNYIVSVIATRLVVNSYSSGATIQYNITQRYV
jgi:hypothetical protein